jgi:hypothetical protein
LIDLEADPFELNNLVDNPEYAGLMKEFDLKIARHMEDTNDRWDIEAIVPPEHYTSHEDGIKALADCHARAIIEL